MPVLKRAADDGYAPAQSLYGYILDKAEYNEEAAPVLSAAPPTRATPTANTVSRCSTPRAKAWGAIPPRRAIGSSARASQGHSSPWSRCRRRFSPAASASRPTRPTPRASAGCARRPTTTSIPALSYLAKGYRSGAFGAADPAQAERMEARIVELADNNRRKARRNEAPSLCRACLCSSPRRVRRRRDEGRTDLSRALRELPWRRRHEHHAECAEASRAASA